MKNKHVLKLDWCSHEAAKFAVMNWHYSKAMPAGKLVKIGVWEKGKFIGVVIYSLGTNKERGDFLKLSSTEICELTRVALNKHVSAVTRILSISLRMLKKQSPGLKCIVSYADPEENHTGGIYRGGNWCFVGYSQMCTAFMVDGKKITNRSYTSMKKKGIKGTPIKIKPKYKFLMPLDKEIKKQIEKLSKTYPKKDCV